MKHTLLFAGSLALSYAFAADLLAAETPVNGTYAYVDVKNTSEYDVMAAPVTLKFDDVIALMNAYRGGDIAAFEMQNANAESVLRAPIDNAKGLLRPLLGESKRPLALQADDLDHDGTIDELTFLINLKAGEQRRVQLEMVEDTTTERKFEKAVYALLAHRDKDANGNETLTPDTAISSTDNDMYNQVALHGMVMESGPVAYRVYFNNKSTIDVYCKTESRLEIETTRWHTTLEDQEALGLGADVLLVGNSVGVGSFRDWNGNYAQHTTHFGRRTQRIIATGNLRNVMELEVNDWLLANGKTIDARIRFTQYAYHHDVCVDVFLSPNARHATFCSGVQKFPNDAPYFAPVGTPLIAIWGTDFPEKDKKAYSIKRTVGLAVAVDRANVTGEREDYDNHLLMMTPDANNHIRYWFTAHSPLEDDGCKTSNEFFKLLMKWYDNITKPLQVTLSK